MKSYIAIVKHTEGKLDKFKDFDTQVEADSHVAEYSGFVVADPGGSTSYWVVDAEAQTVTNDQAQADADALESSWDRLRTERNALLASSDWTQASDSPLTDEVQASWTTYRQELRDLPDITDDPAGPTWPEVPE